MANISDSDRVTFDAASTVPRYGGRQFGFPYFAAGYIFAGVDAVIIVASSLMGCLVYQSVTSNNVENFDAFLFAGLLAAVLYLGIANSGGLYRPTAIFSSRRIYRKILNRWFTVSLLLILIGFLLKIGAVFSRGSVVAFVLMTAVLLLTARWSSTLIFRKAAAEGLLAGHRTVVIGSRNELAAIDRTRLLRDFGLTEIERVVLPEQSIVTMQLGAHELNSLDQALKSARSNGAVGIALALSWRDMRRLDLVRDKMRSSPLPVQLLPDQTIRAFSNNPSFTLQPSLVVEVQRGPLSQFEQLIKRCMDIFGASIAILALLPMFLFVAFAIKCDSPGPVLFRQRRNGFNSRQFDIIKFRSMSVAENDDGIVQAKRFDTRVTRVGRILRMSSMDELPQLFNVLAGDMSLVGPRPHAIVHDDQYSSLLADYAFRHHVKPGITGWAQVNGFRGETPRVELMAKRVEYDLWYINNWSLMFDIKILLRTSFEIARARNAH